jgi:hypothetical protein
MENPRVIGHIVAVQGFRVKVELLPEARSAFRTTLDGIQVAVAINSYVTFSTGAGQLVIRIITDLEAKESYDPAMGGELTLELVRPRRTASVQLLGTIDPDGESRVFNPGITVLPTLDSPAEVCAPETLKAVFETPPKRNKPETYPSDGDNYDCELRIGCPTGQPANVVLASYNDLLSRPLAIVGNTGSGKSFSVASLVQKAMKALGDNGNEPHVFILDINGEYGQAFPQATSIERRPNRVYLNGFEFSIPIWLLNAEEICAWLSAAEQTQEPVLKDWWAIAKSGNASLTGSSNNLFNALSSIEQLIERLPSMQRKAADSYCRAVAGHLAMSAIDTADLEALFASHRAIQGFNQEVVNNQAEIFAAAEALREEIKTALARSSRAGDQMVRTADSPLFISLSTLADPAMVNRSVSREDVFRVEAHLTTLKLRLKTRLDDRRWGAFLNYEGLGTDVPSLKEWLSKFGLGRANGPRVSVIDLSMLSHEVLPYACAVIGRILLEVRENLQASERYKHPWVLVLEEAHNYARPPRSDEDRGQRLSRLSFERIAKEGRKFGISLIVASQRPSEVSPTIVSQCANFVSHRLQNPEDIEHFRKIIPLQARRLLDQIRILSSGEAIVFGSAFHIPARVQFDRPSPTPWSQTAAPFHEWTTEPKPFPLIEVIEAWGIDRKKGS